MISTSGLTKRYGKIEAVSQVDLDVREGDIYGFLGANGSGKTTTVRMLLGLVLATSGEIQVLGQDMPGASSRVLAEVGALVEGPAAYGHLSGRKNLRLSDAAGPARPRHSRAERIERVLAEVGLDEVDERPVRAYSLGMRQRLGIAAALLGRPRLLVLDEPTNGLDPQGIREMRELLQSLNAAGVTIFLSSHLLAEVEQLCTRIGVLDRGRLILQAPLAELRRPTGNTVLITPDPEAALALLNGRVRHRDGQRLVVRGADPAEVNARLVSAGVAVSELVAERRALEDVVLEASSASADRMSAR
ncbi:ABC transporter ATP-binding protein [Jatrophihabitans telluris]|uniref:ABC transporter ATP-binding protein n=1 Tax=Jatrophihabitans telluris TaxID=2038343 RepID=A0ABY4QZ18_9ACTN|nr:ABC transporter ATP-binding protein [Jatrophihabitans telluris]UQX88089.1 ABC transporter ATP-binding protein [Jatrophihabitans telluris]